MEKSDSIIIEHILLSSIICEYFLEHFDEDVTFFLRTFFAGKGDNKKIISVPCIMWDEDYKRLPKDYFSKKNSVILNDIEIDSIKYLSINDLRRYIPDTITILDYPFIISILKYYGIYNAELYYSFENDNLSLNALGKKEENKKIKRNFKGH